MSEEKKDSGSSNPLAQEEKKMGSIVEKVERLEANLREREILIDRLRDLITKSYANCFPPQIKVDSERKE